MQTPYEMLGIGVDASDNDIKQAYLQQVKNNPPDREPEKFQLMHDAYTKIKDTHSRIKYDLFTLPELDFNTFLGQALATEQPAVIDMEALLIASSSEASFASVFSGAEKE